MLSIILDSLEMISSARTCMRCTISISVSAAAHAPLLLATAEVPSSASSPFQAPSQLSSKQDNWDKCLKRSLTGQQELITLLGMTYGRQWSSLRCVRMGLTSSTKADSTLPPLPVMMSTLSPAWPHTSHTVQHCRGVLAAVELSHLTLEFSAVSA